MLGKSLKILAHSIPLVALSILGCSAGIAENGAGQPAAAENVVRYAGMCDASAAVALDDETFIVADDEKNTLLIYRAGLSGTPLQAIPWARRLGIAAGDEHPEADIEAATVLDGRIYWITSHGRNKDGKWRPNRHRFFAMTVEWTGDGYVARPFGKSRGDLVRQLVRHEPIRRLALAEAYAAGAKKVERLAPKREGLNIEGLCATADGKSLLIGLRNPMPSGRALLVPLENPAAVVAEGAAPRFGEPVLLKMVSDPRGKSLDLSFRGIEYSPHQAAYLIAAGTADARDAAAIYRWSGDRSDAPVFMPRATAAVRAPQRFRPEALIVYPNNSAVDVLSDDGSLRVKVASPAQCAPGEFLDGQCQQKHLNDDRQKAFRAVRIGAKPAGRG